MVSYTQNRSSVTATDLDRTHLCTSESECSSSSSSVKPLPPQPWILRRGAASSYTGGLLPNGNVINQQSLPSNGLSSSAFRPYVRKQQAPALSKPAFLPVNSARNHEGGLMSHGNQPNVGDKQLLPCNGTSAVYGIRVGTNDSTVMGMSRTACRPSSTSSFTDPSTKNVTPAMKYEDYLLFIQYAREYSVDLLKHVEACIIDQCPNTLCGIWKIVLQHLRNCGWRQCPICVGVHASLKSYKRKRAGLPGTTDFVPQKRMKTEHFSAQLTATSLSVPAADPCMDRHKVAEMRSKHFVHLGLSKNISDHTMEGAKDTTMNLAAENVEGAEVCLFCMPVQEYGSECPSPNQR